MDENYDSEKPGRTVKCQSSSELKNLDGASPKMEVRLN